MRPPTPPQVRAVIVRFREQHRTYKEIADTVGLGVATVNRILATPPRARVYGAEGAWRRQLLADSREG